MGDVMSKFAINYSQLEGKIYKKAYKLSDVSDKIEKVAFDIVKFKDGDVSSNLWQVQSADDGDYIVALYNEDDMKVTASTWEVSLIKSANSLQISYKGDPLVKIAADKLGIPSNELDKVAEYLPTKLANNKKLVVALLKELPTSVKNSVLNKYPELV
jgi:hypothetical protein